MRHNHNAFRSLDVRQSSTGVASFQALCAGAHELQLVGASTLQDAELG